MVLHSTALSSAVVLLCPVCCDSQPLLDEPGKRAAFVHTYQDRTGQDRQQGRIAWQPSIVSYKSRAQADSAFSPSPSLACPPHIDLTCIRQALHLWNVRSTLIPASTTSQSDPLFSPPSVFEVTTRYVDLQPVGMGAFGLVCSAKDQLTGQSVAVKKIMKPFSTPVLAKRTYRELKLLKHIRHENIISLSDIFISPLEDIYFVTELLGTDLHRLLTSRPLEKQFIQYFLYQILVGLLCFPLAALRLLILPSLPYHSVV